MPPLLGEAGESCPPHRGVKDLAVAVCGYFAWCFRGVIVEPLTVSLESEVVEATLLEGVPVKVLDAQAAVEASRNLDIRADDGVVLSGHRRFLIDERATAILQAVRQGRTLAAVQSDDAVRLVYGFPSVRTEEPVDIWLSSDLRRLHNAGLLKIENLPVTTRPERRTGALFGACEGGFATAPRAVTLLPGLRR